MKINWTKVLTNILWIVGVVITAIVLFGSGGKVDLKSKMPKKAKGTIIIRRRKNEKTNVNHNDIGGSNFDL